MKININNHFINQSINKFLLSINEKLSSIEEMKNGTDSKVVLINNKYIFKFHNTNTIKAEYQFFNSNNNKLNEQIIYVDENFKYIIYRFIESGDKAFNINQLLKIIKDYVYEYSDYTSNGYGFLFEETSSWKEFLESEINDKKDFALSILTTLDYKKVITALNTLNNYTFNKKLMHGDFGLHNMLFLDNKLTGIIDPQPLIGDPLYDFIFFIFSASKISSLININDIYNLIPNEPKEKINAMITIILFGRIARCIKYNLKDKDYFISLWNSLL